METELAWTRGQKLRAMSRLSGNRPSWTRRWLPVTATTWARRTGGEAQGRGGLIPRQHVRKETESGATEVKDESGPNYDESTLPYNPARFHSVAAASRDERDQTESEGAPADLLCDADTPPLPPPFVPKVSKGSATFTSDINAPRYRRCRSSASCFRSHSSPLAAIGAILGACDRLGAFEWSHDDRHEHTGQGVDERWDTHDEVEDDVWATVEEPLKKLLFFACSTSDENVTLRLNQAVGPPIRHWVATGLEDLSSLVPGTFENLPCSDAPSLRKVRFEGMTYGSFAFDENIIDLLDNFPNIEELDLKYQTYLTDATLARLHLHRPLKVLGIGCSGFSLRATTAYLAARGSLIESLCLIGSHWAELDIILSFAPHMPALSTLLTFSSKFLSTRDAVDQLRGSFPSLRVISPPPRDEEALVYGLEKGFVFGLRGGVVVSGLDTARLAGIA
ncbi:hypothetical protein BDK51DRAFT_51514 [Blyttiomyces helicus]|uniref:Uncharacterized protein n=1 Tax=Blyttiomyces helicus TaxID=388810 RepID=A0A4P9W5G9_9FUNG|nr:hypothetical protein BDK51DRAFT_51514 [Blyttiomyces helicus]|eukprot:RKO87504.1 hypothetical protein BDK51DRAFT_51514 [Blyttiomyces helicus]